MLSDAFAFGLPISLAKIIDAVKSDARKGKSFCVYAKNSAEKLHANQECFLDAYPTVNNKDQEVFPEFVSANKLELAYYGEQFEDIVRCSRNLAAAIRWAFYFSQHRVDNVGSRLKRPRFSLLAAQAPESLFYAEPLGTVNTTRATHPVAATGKYVCSSSRRLRSVSVAPILVQMSRQMTRPRPVPPARSPVAKA
jgi:hypothetical protein